MNVNEKLKKLILKQYKSVRAFSIAANIPYSTIATIFKRGILNTNINTMNKICYALNITLDELLEETTELKLIEQSSKNREIELKIIELIESSNFNEPELNEIMSFVNFIKMRTKGNI